MIVDTNSLAQETRLKIDLKRHALIKAQLEIAGWTFTAIGKSIGVAQSSVSTVSQGYRRSHKIQSAIAEILNKTPQELWPERYDQEKSAEDKLTPKGESK